VSPDQTWRIALPVGQRLKALRTNRHVTIREVEQASRRIAEAKRDTRFFISNGWLAQLEKGVSEPGICKLFSLSVIYRVKFFELIRLYDVDIDEIEKLEPVANPHMTQLVSAETKNDFLLSLSGSSLRQRRTSLMPGAALPDRTAFVSARDRGTTPTTYGYIGLNDFTMYPLIRPGSLVRIDTGQHELQSVVWHNEYERPIYFIELRGAHACGWCELHGNDLLIVPHHSSPESIRSFTYPKDAEIVGQVIGFDTRCVDKDSNDLEIKESKGRGKSHAR
jgi:transcriptional regulator with XRE-family HTH domain